MSFHIVSIDSPQCSLKVRSNFVSKLRAFALSFAMLTEYIQAAMRRAHYEIMEDGRFFGEIAQCPGAWGEGATLEDARDELQETLESWIIVGLRHGDRFEVIDGVDLNPRAAYAEADQTA